MMELLRTLYSVRMRENTDQRNTPCWQILRGICIVYSMQRQRQNGSRNSRETTSESPKAAVIDCFTVCFEKLPKASKKASVIE